MMEERKKPAVTLPIDADGHSIPLDTEALYSGPDKVKVLSFSYYPLADYWTRSLQERLLQQAMPVNRAPPLSIGQLGQAARRPGQGGKWYDRWCGMPLRGQCWENLQKLQIRWVD